MARLSKILKELTPSRVRTALYIDFEGLGKKKDGSVPRPALLGILGSKSYRAVVFEEKLAPLTKGRAGFPGEREIDPDFDSVIAALVERAKGEGRPLLHFSEHEKKMIETFCSANTASAFLANSANAKLLIDRWAKQTRPNLRPEERTLDAYCKMVGIKPPVAPKRGVAETIRRLGTSCRKTKRWSNLSASHQDLARSLFHYNREDCRVLRRATLRAVNSFKDRGGR